MSAIACSRDDTKSSEEPEPPSVELFRFRDPEIAESSGVATASYRDDLLFTHNDSGDAARFFAVDFDGNTVATYTVAGAKAVDWEDMARGPHQDRTPGQSLYLGDIGNNLGHRTVHEIYEVDEPVVGRASGDLRLRSVIRVSYPDGPHDAEALLVHPRTGQVVLVTKEIDGATAVYARTNGVMTKVATVGGSVVTGGAFGPAGDRLVLRTYQEAFEWRVGADLAQSLSVPPVVTPVPEVAQGEAVTYANDGGAFLTTTEGAGGPVYRVRSTL